MFVLNIFYCVYEMQKEIQFMKHRFHNILSEQTHKKLILTH